MNTIRFLAFSFFFLISTSLTAGVIDIDDVSFGGNTYRAFVDDTTDLVWLDLDNFWDETSTYDDLIALLDGSGYHLATLSEIEQLFLSIPAVPANFASEVVIIGGNNVSRDLMWGIYEDGTPEDGVSYAFRYGNDTEWAFTYNAVLRTDVFSINNATDKDLGAWIVGGEFDMTATPVPALGWQMMLLLMVLLAGSALYYRSRLMA